MEEEARKVAVKTFFCKVRAKQKTHQLTALALFNTEKLDRRELYFLELYQFAKHNHKWENYIGVDEAFEKAEYENEDLSIVLRQEPRIFDEQIKLYYHEQSTQKQEDREKIKKIEEFCLVF